MASVPAASAVAVYAGFWRRSAAWLADFLILLVPLVAIVLGLGHTSGIEIVLALDAVVWWIYKAALESGPLQGTVGKRVAGIKVVDTEGGRISFARATLRYFASYLSIATFGVGLLMAAFTRRRQALHDLAAKTLVVDAAASVEQVRVGAGTMPLSGGVAASTVVMVLVPLVLFGYVIPAYQGSVYRMRVTEVIGELARVRNLVADDILARKRAGGAPGGAARRDFKSESRMVTKVSVDLDAGTISAFIDHERFGHHLVARGSSVSWTAVTDGSTVEWKCSSSTVPAKLLPAACR